MSVSVMKRIRLFGSNIDVPVTLPIGGQRPDEVNFRKELEQSDISAGQSRLFIPDNFLTKEERDTLKALAMDQENQTASASSTPSSFLSLAPSSSSSSLENKKKRKKATKKPGMDVEVKDSEGRRFKLKLTYWSSVDRFVLNKGWNECVLKNELVKGDVIKLTCRGRRPGGHDDFDGKNNNNNNNNNNNKNKTMVLCLGLEIIIRRKPRQKI
ncbi:OLC1v1035858C1 [Oldenlandia corymbosa var. corymbosa]|uniref:OLC1v1035854C1 n=1 Tax=Oldenlandia corymbosa var. corymbosa TaxID=529605 RepID=A0AAV1CV30_OLDCO|nr:OLC1v1035854C1 [Oldenlandia corymbosa var. corymbosa]CAI9099087.1 OLC1v1035858C1 [Oldenlandia corymbosa var. corymbosa]